MIYDRDSMKRFGAAIAGACTHAFNQALKNLPGLADLEHDVELLKAIEAARRDYMSAVVTEIQVLEKTL
jgi:hypothetical protein